MDSYNFDKAMREVENFAWKEFADHYVEMIKHRTRGDDRSVKYTLYTVYLGILKMMAPMLPHVTEDAYQAFADMDGARSIHVSKWPEPERIDEDAERKGDLAKEVIASVRTWKAEKKYPLNKELARVEIVGKDAYLLRGYEDDIAQTVRASVLELLEEAHLDSHPAVIRPVHSKLGPLFKNYAKEIVGQLVTMDPAEARTLLEKDGIDLLMNDGRKVRVTSDLVEVVCELQYQGKAVDTLQVGDLLLVIEA